MKKYILYSTLLTIFGFSSNAFAQWNVIEENKISHLGQKAQMSCDAGYGHKKNRPQIVLRFEDPISYRNNIFVSYKTDKKHVDYYLLARPLRGNNQAQMLSLPPSNDGFNDAMIKAMKESNWIIFTEKSGGDLKINLSGFTKAYDKMIDMCN